MLTRHSVVRRFNKSSLGRQPLCKKSPAKSLIQAGIFTLMFKDSFLTYPQLSQDHERAQEIQSLESKQKYLYFHHRHTPTGLLAMLFCVYHFFSNHTKKISTRTYVVILMCATFLSCFCFPLCIPPSIN